MEIGEKATGRVKVGRKMRDLKRDQWRGAGGWGEKGTGEGGWVAAER